MKYNIYVQERQKSLQEIPLVKVENPNGNPSIIEYQSKETAVLRNMLVFLLVEGASDLNKIDVTPVISKPLDFAPIRCNSVSVILQDIDDQLYSPLKPSTRSEGILREARLRSASASEVFQFEGSLDAIKRAILFLEGEVTSFKFPSPPNTP